MANDGLTIDTQALRQKILDLAMRGKLMPQDPNDEPASNLLKKIASEKDQLVKDKKIKRSKKLSPITEDEKPFEIPDSWEWVRIKTLLRPQQKIKPKNIFQYIDIASVDNKKNEIVTPKLINPHKEKVPVRASQLLKNGDVLFSTVRPYLRNIAMVTEEYNDAIGTSGWYVLKTFKQVNSQFIFYVVLSNYVINGLTRHMKGDNSPSIRKSDLETFVIPFPPLAEQSRIAAKVARLFALLRKVESSNDEYNLLKQIMKDKIINLAMEGKLVKQDPHDEPASVLVKKIADEKAQLIKEKKIKRTKKLPAITDEEKPFDIPDSWEWVHLEAISYLIGGKSNQIKEKESLETGKYRVVSQSQKKFIGFTNESSKVLSPQIDCIVFGDHTALVKYINFDFVIGGDGVKVFETLPGVDTKYLYYAFRYNLIGIAGLGGYSRHFKYIKNKPIPLPPLQEQKRIVYKIEQFMKWLDGEAL
ncbi:hypothetical protein CBF87_07190 [Limosilactobacillus reuteri]|uniref:restriction endonuclease subunit S n=1 Tax=Limosilactobacillus reuteri TaxID=1598 RepID=UPI000B99B1B0|nr:restriction endonuclease subunit S [Limosilactobacillus reuteri]OYS46184.1 hypothetical protein CBF87_07190 [Limosilactobacillus reuteri]OYS52338.1 hypothetical protein CBF81_07000 [Limosilactobacillus reuteri]